MDGDTLRLAGQVAQTASLRDACCLLGPKTVLYPLQPPFLWAAAWGGALVWPGWNPLSAARLATILALVAIAWLLARLAGDAGAGPGGRAVAAAFPFCWHGFSFLVGSCDDNVVTDALRLAAVFATTRWLASPPGGRRHLVAGAALGGAMLWHFQSVLLFPAVAIAGLWESGREGSSRRREIAVALLAGAVIWAAGVGGSVLAGRGPAPELSALARATVENHREGRLWAPRSARTPATQAAVVGEGWSRMILGFDWLRPAGGAVAVAMVVALATILGVGCAVVLAGTPLGRVLGPVVAIQSAHSFLYESESIERWDLPVMVSGLALAAAFAACRRRTAKPKASWAGSVRGPAGSVLGAGGAALAVALVACNVTAYVRFARGAESAFLDVVEGRRTIAELNLDCVGAHWRLCRVARGVALEAGPGDAFAGMLQAKVPDVFHQYWLTSWCTAYLICYAPGFLQRPAARPLWISLLRAPPPSHVILRQEGFVYLAAARRP